MIGNILVENTYNINNETEMCTTIPWSNIVTNMYAQILRDTGSAPFDVLYALNNPPKYQVSVFYDSVFADEDDLFTLPGLNVDVNDWLPDTARVADGEYNPYTACGHNSAGGYGDLGVDANDVSDFLSEFGRACFWCAWKCPNCKK